LSSAAHLKRFDRLNVWTQGDQRAPHKPLLVLSALGPVATSGAAWKRCDTGSHLRSNPMSAPEQPSASRHDPLDAILLDELLLLVALGLEEAARHAVLIPSSEQEKLE
jgi:hypothetical protein